MVGFFLPVIHAFFYSSVRFGLISSRLMGEGNHARTGEPLRLITALELALTS